MKTYLFLGDTHGDLDFVERAAALAAGNDATIIQVGDWGFIWPKSDQVQALDLTLVRAGEYLAKPPVKMLFIDGNHDHHPELRRRMQANCDYDHCDPNCPGVGTLTPNVIYQPRGSVYEDDDGTRFLFCGGAPSIDKDMRVEGRSWWPQETITEDEFQKALAVEGPIHVLVTHDAPDYPPGFLPKGDPEFRAVSARSMAMVRELINHHRPLIHVHGHWHHSYTVLHACGTETVGLDCNYAPLTRALWLWNRL